MLNQKLSVVVCSCDKYEDTWLPFFTLYKKYFNLNVPIWLNTESKSYSSEGLEIQSLCIHNNNTPWGKRFRDYLCACNTKYVLILLDDFFIRRPVNLQLFFNALDILENDDRSFMISFGATPDPNNINCQYMEYFQRPQFGKYKLNLQAGLWRREKLLSLVRDGDNPWDFEDYGNYRTFFLKDKFYCVKHNGTVIDYGNNGSIWGIFRGKWVDFDIVPFFESETINVDYNTRGFHASVSIKKPLSKVVFDLPRTITINIINLYKRVFNLLIGLKLRDL